MLQHKLYVWEKKPTKWKTKGGKVLLNCNLLGESIERERPLSTGDLMDQKVLQVDEGIFLRSRAATYNGPSSSFCDFTSTDTCYNCLFDEENGKTFCEIMGSRYCTQCIKTSRQKEIDEEVTSALGIQSENGGGSSSFGDTFFHITQGSPTLAFSNDRRLFTRLHNLNSNSDYYINPTNGTETALASTQEIPCESGSSQVTLNDHDKNMHATSQSTPNYLQIPGVKQTKQGSLGKKRRKNGGTGKMKRKFVTFNGLPIEPPLITVDLSNQIMNHLVIKD